MSTTTIKEVDYVVIQCCYVYRLVPSVGKIRKFLAEEEYDECECEDSSNCKCSENMVVFIDEAEPGEEPSLWAFGKNEDVAKVSSALKEKYTRGSICFASPRNGRLSMVMIGNILDQLIKLRHCCWFGGFPSSLKYIQKDSYTVLHMTFDTESG